MRDLLPVAVLLASLGFVPAVSGQSLTVAESEPLNGEAKIPLQTQIRFTFSEAVAVTNDWNRVITVEPRDSVDVSRVTLLVDSENVPRIVIYTVTHTADTDISWLVHSVESSAGSGLEEPFVLRYSTGSDIGPRTVSGSVIAASLTKRGAVAAEQPFLRAFAGVLQARGTPAFRQIDPTARSEASHVSAAGELRPIASDYTEILLLNLFSVQSPEWDVAAASVILGSSGTFEVAHVRPGIYYPVAVHYSDFVIDALGFYDEDADGEPDGLNVGTLDRQNIDVQIFAFPKVGAESYVDRARASYSGGDGDDLVLIKDSYGSTPDGTAYVWSYDFFDTDQNRVVTVEVDPLLEKLSAVTAPNHVPGMTPIGSTFVGSEAALELVREGGGDEFLATVPERDRRTVIEGGNQYWLFDHAESRTFWRVRFFNLRSGESYEGLVEMEEGRVITGAEEQPDIANGPALGPNFPNPFTLGTTIPISIPAPVTVHLMIYNVLGQKVADLVQDELLNPGTHLVQWTASGLAPGLYVCELRAGQTNRSRLLVLQR